MSMSESSEREIIGDAAEALEQVYKSAIPAGQRLIESLVNTTPLGMGAEKVVYDYGPDRVICFFPHTERPDAIERIKNTYYKTKLMHLLEPLHVPDAHFAGRYPPVIVLAKVAIGKPDRGIWHKERQELMDRLYKNGVVVDTNEHNYIKGADGHVKYVDSFWVSKIQKLKAAVDQLPEDIRPRAQRYLQRLDMKLETGWYTFGSSRAGEYVPPTVVD